MKFSQSKCEVLGMPETYRVLKPMRKRNEFPRFQVAAFPWLAVWCRYTFLLLRQTLQLWLNRTRTRRWRWMQMLTLAFWKVTFILWARWRFLHKTTNISIMSSSVHERNTTMALVFLLRSTSAFTRQQKQAAQLSSAMSADH